MKRSVRRVGDGLLLFSLILLVGCTSGSGLVGVPNSLQGSVNSPNAAPGSGGGPPPLPATDAGLVEHVPQQLIIRFLPGALTETILKEINGTVLGQLKTFDAVVVGLPQGASIVDAIRKLQAMSGVKYAEPNYIYRAFITPNDTFFATKQWGPQQIQAPAAWNVTTGSVTSVIAIIDTGVSITSSEFTGKLLPGIRTTPLPVSCTTASGVTDDDNGHGTHVSGIAAAIGNDGAGIAGISWLSPIVPVKVLDSSGSGTVATIVCGLNFVDSFATANKSDTVVANLSLGGPGYSQLFKDAIDNVIRDNVVVVAAAGNSGSAAVLFPAGLPGVMAVGATDPTNARAPFSTYGSQLSVVAPGVDIYSTVPTSGTPISSPAGFAFESGTSMAAPHVTGVAALVRAKNPSFSVSQVRSQIEQTATRLPSGSMGFNPQFGWGLVNAAAAVTGTITSNYGGVQVGVTHMFPGTVSLVPSNTGGSLAAGTYYVKVTAVDLNFQESTPSLEASAIVTATTPTGSIAASWTAVPSTEEYKIYVGTTSGGENTWFIPAPVINSTSFTITTTSIPPGTAGSPPSSSPTPQVDVSIWTIPAGATNCITLNQVVQTTQTTSNGVAVFSAVPAASYCATASSHLPAKGQTTSPFTVIAGSTTSVPVTIM